MNQMNDPEAILRAADNIGAGSSLWLRPLRLFFELGKPPGEIAVLAFQHPRCTWPFGVATKTKGGRIVFWPVLPTRPSWTDPAGNCTQIDHFTLEFPSERIHATGFGSQGKRLHYGAPDFGAGNAWRLQHYAGTGASLFLAMIVKFSTLVDQENIVQRRVAMPTTDAERRKREFADYAGRLRVLDVGLPPVDGNADYVFSAVYYDRGPGREPKFTAEIFPNVGLIGEIEGFPTDYLAAIQLTAVCLDRETRLIIATCCPPGIAKQPVSIGLPCTRPPTSLESSASRA